MTEPAVTVSVPDLFPLDVGVNVTLMMQLAPAASALHALAAVAAKGAAVVAVTATVELPVLDTMTV